LMHGFDNLDTASYPGASALPKLTNGEINKLIMSLAALELPADQDENAYDDKNLLSPDLYETLRDALREKAFQAGEIRTYALNDGETEVTFNREDNQLDSFTMNYFDHKRSQAVSVQLELQPFDLKFFTFGFHEDIGHKLPLIPTTGDISDVRRLIRREIEFINPGALSGEKDDEKPEGELN